MRLTKLRLKTEEKKKSFSSRNRDFRGAVGHYVTVGGIKGSLSLSLFLPSMSTRR